MKWWKKIYSVILFFLILLGGGVFVSHTLQPDVLLGSGSDSSVILNLTFDSGLSDESAYSNSLSVVGSASQTNDSICKWYGCANFTAMSGDYLTGSWAANYSHMAIGRWVYYTEMPGDGAQQSTFQFGSVSTGQHTEYSTYCFASYWEADAGRVNTNSYSSGCVQTGRWYFVFEQYDGVTYDIWLNGDDFYHSSSEPWGDLKHDVGDSIRIGEGGYSFNFKGYMDEFVVYNRSNFTTADVEAMYQAKALGTPSAVDLYVKDFKYSVPWQTVDGLTNINRTGNLSVTVTFANAGINASGDVTYQIVLDDVVFKSGTLNLSGQSEVNVSFSFAKQNKVFNGSVVIDSSNVSVDDDWTNNYIPFYIPLNDFPRWTVQDCDSPTSSTPWSNSCTYYKNYLSEDFNPSWGAANVDPRGKKGYENAVACYANDYNESKTQCVRALNHVDGWLNIPAQNYYDASVQATHQFMYVAATFDIMLPMLNESQIADYSEKLYNISYYLTLKTEPFNDPGLTPHPEPGNGWGFGNGIGVASYLIGVYDDNPLYLLRDPQRIGGHPQFVYWKNRQESYVMGMGNSTEFKYPEGFLYKVYGQNNFFPALYWLDRMNMTDLPEKYPTTFNGMAKELLFFTLDDTYNGNVLRNDENREWRTVNYGDSNSFEDWGSDTPVQYAIVTFLGYYATNQTIKDALFYLRGLTAVQEPRSMFEMGDLYRDLAASSTAQLTGISSYSRDPVFDSIWYRSGFTYDNDCMWVDDGGDHFWSGHPVASGYYFYCYGEPFIDFVQVPFYDDVRNEIYANTIAYYNQSEDSGVGYVGGCGEADLNQHYGDLACELNGSWYDFQLVPESLAGYFADEYGSFDASVGAYKKVVPMSGTANGFTEQVLRLGNVTLRRVINEESPNDKVEDSILNIATEFNGSFDGANLTIQRTGTFKFMSVDVVYSNTSLYSYGGDSGIRYSFTKTGTANGDGNYNLFVVGAAVEGADFVRAYIPYESTKPFSVELVGDYFDVDGVAVYMDLDKNGTIDEGLWSTDAWAIAELNDSSFLYAGATYVRYNGSLVYNGVEASGVASYEAVADVTPPSFSSVSVGSLTNTSAVINVLFDEAANVTAVVGGVGSFSESDFSVSQSVLVSGLSANTTYFYNLTASDFSGNTNQSLNNNFTTEVYESGDCLTLAYYLGLKGVNWTIYASGALEYVGCSFTSWTPGGGTVI